MYRSTECKGANWRSVAPYLSVAGDFRKLEAYRRVQALASDLHRRVSSWPGFHRSVIGVQLVRSAYSVGANIAESNGRWHPKDRRQFLYIARGSLSELEHWMASAEEQALLDEGASKEIDEIARLLNGLINRLG